MGTTFFPCSLRIRVNNRLKYVMYIYVILFHLKMPTHILKIFVHDANFCIYSNSDYSNHLNLHIGVTTSSAAIVEFDRLGLRRHSVSSKAMKNQWAQSLLVEKVPEAWTEHWDDVLQVICKEPVWTPQDYHEDRHNCYTFVLRFLKELAYGELSQAAQSR